MRHFTQYIRYLSDHFSAELSGNFAERTATDEPGTGRVAPITGKHKTLQLSDPTATGLLRPFLQSPIEFDQRRGKAAAEFFEVHHRHCLAAAG